ncbi:PQQ-dependent dehydrogenase, methanol/ethanol family [Halioxenophilus aromaticivorans]|uniref:PQQ-dependent dehydrogenase, methanol/ethanol family n=1 Tax=Halioxenophilus aromaticivorans TaxID=1306992 RepID=UPI0031EBB6B0
MSLGYKVGCFMVFGAVLAGCGEERKIDDNESKRSAVAEQSKTVDWAQHGLTNSEQRYSPLTQIGAENINQLSLAWYYDLPEQRAQEATPLIIDGVLYSSSAWNHVHALNAATGEVMWEYDAKVDKTNAGRACCDAINRGLAFGDGRLYMGAIDGRLIALDANTGKELWVTQTFDLSKQYSITGAPRVANGKVFIGNGGAEYGVRGYISAYDTSTGELVWRFYTVPGGPGDPTGTEPVESQTATWDGEWWKLGGGGTVWDSMAFDAELNLLYFGVGNGSPWNPMLRSNGKGDNWFLSSIVAVDADTGEYRWHYQTTPGEGWDYTATQHLILAELELASKPRKVVMQAPKNGFFYLLDRASGELLSAEPYVPVNWASHVDMATGRPQIADAAKYWLTDTPALITPSWMGGHNWHPMSYSQQTGLVYIPAHISAYPYLAEPDQKPSKLTVNMGVDTTIAAFPDEPEALKQVQDATYGMLLAWDPVAQKEVWRVQYPGVWNGGILSTAGGLVFQGTATGFLAAYNASTGEQLWQQPTQTGIVAPPVTFMVDGEQYITVSAGWGGVFPNMTGPLTRDSADGEPINRSRLLTYKLGGTSTLPAPTTQARTLPDTSHITTDPSKVARGFATYDRYCVHCHGAGAVGGGVLPDLRYSAMPLSRQAFKSVVYDGVLSERGMISFASELSEQDIEQIRQYVIDRNQQARRVGETQRLSR